MESSITKPVKSFRELKVWQEAYKLAQSIYSACEKFPIHERFGLSSQMTRSSVSVCSNIAEGFGRRSALEKDQFYAIANGSLTELENQVLIAYGVKYLDKNSCQKIMNQCTISHKMLTNLQKANKVKGERG